MSQSLNQSQKIKGLFTFIEDRSQIDSSTEEMFSGNYVIHAYETGKLKGREEQIKDIREAIKGKNQENQQYTISVINDLVSDMVSNGVYTKGGWLKKEGSSKYDAIISVPQEIYMSEKIDAYYEKAYNIETAANNPNYTLNIRFINEAKIINQSMLDCDGYKLRFNVEVEVN